MATSLNTAPGDPVLLVIAVFVMVALVCVLVYQALALRESQRRIEERNRLLQDSNQLLQQAAELGLHTAEICHNLNHFLQTRQLYTQLLDEQGWRPDWIRQLELSNRNMQQIVRQTQEFLAGMPPTERDFPLPATLDDSLRTMRQHLGSDIPAHVEVAADATFRFDESLPQVLNNIFINAGESMKNRTDARLHIQAAADAILVRDTGAGMPEAWQNTLFIAQTTPQGRIAGLGLAFLRKTCQRNGCSLEVSSSSEGTCVTITRLPRTA